MKVICPYCGDDAQFVDSKEVYKRKSFGMIYICRPCDAYVGAHKVSGKPFGRLADKHLRRWRMEAHSIFDHLWQDGGMPRRDAYRVLADLMGLEKKHVHIGDFDIEQCQMVIKVMQTYLRERVSAKKQTC